MQKFGDQPQTQGHSKIPTISQSAGSTQTSPSKSANQLSESDDSLRALVDQYREEVQQFGRYEPTLMTISQYNIIHVHVLLLFYIHHKA